MTRLLHIHAHLRPRDVDLAFDVPHAAGQVGGILFHICREGAGECGLGRGCLGRRRLRRCRLQEERPVLVQHEPERHLPHDKSIACLLRVHR